MAGFSVQRLAQIAIGILLLIIARSLGEFFRVQTVEGDTLTIAQVAPYVGSALFTTAVLAAALLVYAWGRYRLVIGGTVATIVALLIYKIAVIG